MKDKDSYAVDLDGTLAFHDRWRGKDHVGEPIPEMLERVKGWLKDGKKVSIFTARADKAENIPAIRAWLRKHLGQELPVTNVKRPHFSRIFDDRAVTVERNTGRILTAGRKARRMAIRA